MTEMLHVLGLCGDTHTHYDVLDVLLTSGGLGYFLFTFKMYARIILFIIKDTFNGTKTIEDK